jgi:hypothetical protein
MEFLLTGLIHGHAPVKAKSIPLFYKWLDIYFSFITGTYNGPKD